MRWHKTDLAQSIDVHYMVTGCQPKTGKEHHHQDVIADAFLQQILLHGRNQQ
jgi:hypothetical protein